MITPEKKIKEPLPFSAFEWKIAFRYFRSKKKEGFISIISFFSLIGIMLGVATLIIVLAGLGPVVFLSRTIKKYSLN